MDILDRTTFFPFFFGHLFPSLSLVSPLFLPARVEPVSRPACVHGSDPRLSGQAANDIMLSLWICVCLLEGETESDSAGQCDTLSVSHAAFAL